MTSTWRELVEDARWAPSPHNTQPWLVRPRSQRGAELFAPADRLLPVEDPDGRFLTAGLGIFIEALSVAAAARGRRLEWECLHPSLGADAEALSLVARLSLADGHGSPRFARELLERRRTSRLPYDGRRPPDDDLAALAAVAAELGHEASFTTDPALVEWVVGLNADTVFYDLDEDDRRAEIASWTHASERAARAGNGFSPRCLGFPPPLVWLFFHAHWLFHGPVRAAARRLYLRSMASTSTVGWMAGPWSAPEEWLDAGRMLMRFWLALTERGLYLQPFGSVITNPTAHGRLAERLAVDESEREVWLLFRLGYGPEPPRSARRPLEEMLA